MAPWVKRIVATFELNPGERDFPLSRNKLQPNDEFLLSAKAKTWPTEAGPYCRHIFASGDLGVVDADGQCAERRNIGS